MQIFLGDLTISRLKGSAKTCFEILQTYIVLAIANQIKLYMSVVINVLTF